MPQFIYNPKINWGGALGYGGGYTEYDIKTILSRMARHVLKTKAAKPLKVTTDSDNELPIAPNLLARYFTIGGASQKRTGAVTYLYASEGFLGLVMIIDIPLRALIGWLISEPI